MKILLLTDRMEAGGAETHVTELARGLVRLGADVTLTSGGGAMSDVLSQEGVRVLQMPLFKRNPVLWLQMRLRLSRLVKREKYDVLHAHARIPASLIRGLGRRYGCAELVTVHAKYLPSPLLSRFSYWGRTTVTVSEDLAAYLQKQYRVPAERIHVIANGIDCARFSPDPSSKKESEPLGLLFASRLDADCSLGAELLCRIAPGLLRRFPDLRIGIAGGGNAFSHIKSLALEANRIIGFEAVTLHGHVKDMASLLKKQEIFVGVSRAAMEAGASGCAVILCGNEGYGGILTAETAHAAALSNFCCRDCRRADTYRLQNDLLSLLESPELRHRYASESQALIQSRFGTEKMCRETYALYHHSLTPTPKKTVTVGGYFGCGNLGDDLLLIGFLEGLHSVAPDIRVLAFTGDPHRDSRRFGIKCVNRHNPFSLLAALLRSDAFLLGGGSLLQNATSNRSLYYYLLLLRLARLMGATPILYSAGIGPLEGKRPLVRTKKALHRCAYLSLRDPISLRLTEALGIDRSRLYEGADPALLSPLPPVSRSAYLLQALELDERTPYLCIILKGGRKDTDVQRIVTAAVRMLCKRHFLRPIFLIFDPNHDRQASISAAQTLDARCYTPSAPSQAAALIKKAQAVITMRLHGMVLATATGTPAVGVVCDPKEKKITAFANQSGQIVLPLDTLSVAAVVESVEQALRERAALRPIFTDAVADLRKKARKDLANISAIVYNRSRNATKSEDFS